ncbi:MAG: hypothetical protein LBK02_10215 [Treponema sp.]|jgi:hypothetical protein|nr:hypothetical protein [Treponema sp.]
MQVKKIVLALFVLAAVCTAAGAQITFGSWGRAVITPLTFMGDHSAVSAATSTWGDVPRVGFSANGTAPSENIGFNIDFDFGVDVNTGNVAIIGDNAKTWVKPLGLVLPERFNMLKLTAGFFKEDDFRGRIAPSEFGSWLLYNGAKNEDNIFSRFDASAGAHFKLEPLMWLESDWDGLVIEGAFGSNRPLAAANKIRAIYNLLNNEDNNTTGVTYPRSEAEDTGSRTVSVADVYKAMQIALAYRIPNVGLARVQFIGNNREVFRWGESSGSASIVDIQRQLMIGLNKTIPDADVIEAAFLYDGSEELVIDFGVKIPLEYKTKAEFTIYPRVIGSDNNPYDLIENLNREEAIVQRPYVFALGVRWTPAFLNALSLTVRADLSLGGSIKKTGQLEVTNGMALNAWLMPSFRVGANVILGLDVGIDLHGEDTIKRTGLPEIPAWTEVSKYTDFGIGPWIELGVGGGRVRTGVIVMIPERARYVYNENSNAYRNSPILTGDPVISVPISFTYSF